MSLTFYKLLIKFYYNILLRDKYLLLVSLLSHAEFGEYLVDEIVFKFFANDLAK